MRPLPSQKMRALYKQRLKAWSENFPKVTITFGDIGTKASVSDVLHPGYNCCRPWPDYFEQLEAKGD